MLRYQLGDWSPYIYKTEDFGASWRRLTDGTTVSRRTTRRGSCARIRSAPACSSPGTEFGVFVSLDDGAEWHAFQQNLAVTPVTDLKIVRGDLALSTMGRSFWVLDNVSTLRQDAFLTTADAPVLFRPKDTIRYRRVSRGRGGAVPDYPAPAVLVDYYLPDGISGPVRLDVLDHAGALVGSYRSGREKTSSETPFVVDRSLSAEPGMHRYRWDMTHFGPWTASENARYRRGPLVKPGTYTLRLVAAGVTSEQTFELLVDPRVLAQGTSREDIDAQVDFELVVVELLSDVRRFEKQVADEHEELEKRKDELSPDEAARLTLITDVLDRVKTADITYPRPMLTNQVSYLYGMVSRADQAPGVEAAERPGRADGRARRAAGRVRGGGLRRSAAGQNCRGEQEARKKQRTRGP